MSLILALALGQAQVVLPEWQMVTLTITAADDTALVFADKASVKREGDNAYVWMFIVSEKSALKSYYEFDCKGERFHALSLFDADKHEDVNVAATSFSTWRSGAGPKGLAFAMQSYACKGAGAEGPVQRSTEPIYFARQFIAQTKADAEKAIATAKEEGKLKK